MHVQTIFGYKGELVLLTYTSLLWVINRLYVKTILVMSEGFVKSFRAKHCQLKARSFKKVHLNAICVNLLHLQYLWSSITVDPIMRNLGSRDKSARFSVIRLYEYLLKITMYGVLIELIMR